MFYEVIHAVAYCAIASRGLSATSEFLIDFYKLVVTYLIAKFKKLQTAGIGMYSIVLDNNKTRVRAGK